MLIRVKSTYIYSLKLKFVNEFSVQCNFEISQFLNIFVSETSLKMAGDTAKVIRLRICYLFVHSYRSREVQTYIWHKERKNEVRLRPTSMTLNIKIY